MESDHVLEPQEREILDHINIYLTKWDELITRFECPQMIIFSRLKMIKQEERRFNDREVLHYIYGKSISIQDKVL